MSLSKPDSGSSFHAFIDLRSLLWEIFLPLQTLPLRDSGGSGDILWVTAQIVKCSSPSTNKLPLLDHMSKITKLHGWPCTLLCSEQNFTVKRHSSSSCATTRDYSFLMRAGDILQHEQQQLSVTWCGRAQQCEKVEKCLTLCKYVALWCSEKVEYTCCFSFILCIYLPPGCFILLARKLIWNSSCSTHLINVITMATNWRLHSTVTGTS